LAICLDPAGLCLPFLAAAAIHEAGHLLCLEICHVPVTAFQIGALGATLSTGPMTGRQELLCAAAGPGINLLSGAMLAGAAPRFLLLSLMLALFNLLPLYPLDGGRILRVLLPGLADRIALFAGAGLFLAGAVLTAVLHQGLWPLLLLGTLLAKIAVNQIQEQKLIANHASGLYNKETTTIGGTK